MKKDEQKTKAELIAELEALRASKNTAAPGYFEQMVDHLPQPIYQLDIDGMLTYVNAAGLKAFGFTQEDMDNGLHVLDAIHPDFHEAVQKNIGSVLAGGSDTGAEYLGRRADGSSFPIKVYSQGLFDGDTPIGLRGVLIDISDIKEVQAALNKSETYYRTLFENTGTAMITINPDTVIISCNSQYGALAGYPVQEIKGKMSWTDFVAPDDLERMLKYNTERRRQGHESPDNYRFTFMARGGVRKQVHIFVRTLPGTMDQVCSLIDVTDREEAIRALRESEQRYELVSRGANDGIWDWNLTTNEVWFSKRYKEILGYTDEDFPNHLDSWKMAIHPDDEEHAIAVNMECMKGRVDHFEVEYRMLHKDGSIRWILGRGSSATDEDGNVNRLAGTHTDITARTLSQRTTHALYSISSAVSTTRDLKELYETIHGIIDRTIHAKNFFIAMWDKEKDQLHFVYFVDEMDEYYTLDNISDPSINSLTINIFRTGDPMLASSENAEDIARMQALGIIGTPPAHWLGVPLKLNDSVVGAMVVQDYDNPNQYSSADVEFMTAVSEQVAMAIERKASEEELEAKVEQRTAELKAQTGKLEKANKRLLELDEIKSSLVSSVSHELRTPLTSIRGFAKLCARDFSNHFSDLHDDPKRVKKSDRIRKNLGIIDTEGERLTRLINDFLDINRIESGKASWHDHFINPCEIIEKSVQAASGSFATSPEVEFKVDLPDTCRVIHADPDKIQQVVINLLNNAYKFTTKGAVTVALKEDPTAITVSICDTGPGIPEKERPHLFEKFHKYQTGDTVTSQHKGTGLGLAICKEIVQHYNGTIWVDSVLGEGSCFSFTLPTV